MRPPGKTVILIVDDDLGDRQFILDGFLENNPAIDYVFIEDGIQLIETLHAAEPHITQP